MMSQRLVYWNGRFIPESEARVSIYDSALMFGDTVFEMTRSFNKKQFKLREHLERLYASIRYLRIPVEMTIDEMEQAVLETIEKNEHLYGEDDEHRIMIDVTRGLLSLYDGNIDGVSSGPNIIIADFPLRWTVQSMAHLYDTGINAVVPSQRNIPARLLEPKVKNRSRIHYLMANIEVAQMAGSDNWALLLDEDGFITEGTGDNFFIVKDGKVITPEGRNILRGISRDYIFEICEELGLPCEEKNIEPYDVYEADEAFMTATPFCILPVMRFCGEDVGDGKMGNITKELLDKWSSNVGVDIIQQIRDYAKDATATSGASPYEFKKK
jgi:branched-chain amino acid aminotransferase